MNRLEEVPRMKWGQVQIPATLYNQVRLSLLRLRTPRKQLRFSSGLRDLEIILEEHCWYCVDVSMNDLPVLAWDDFAYRRDNLHQPIHCRLSLYHAHAESILDTIQTAIMNHSQARLNPHKSRLSNHS